MVCWWVDGKQRVTSMSTYWELEVPNCKKIRLFFELHGRVIELGKSSLVEPRSHFVLRKHLIRPFWNSKFFPCWTYPFCPWVSWLLGRRNCWWCVDGKEHVTPFHFPGSLRSPIAKNWEDCLDVSLQQDKSCGCIKVSFTAKRSTYSDHPDILTSLHVEKYSILNNGSLARCSIAEI